MTEILTKLGIDWKLLISQGLNFAILLTALTFLVYRPLMTLVAKRRAKIEEGLRGAEEATARLAQIDQLKKEQLAQARQQAFQVVTEAEGVAKQRADEILSETHTKAAMLLKEAQRLAEHKKTEELEHLRRGAGELIKAALVATVQLDPTHVDEALIEQAFTKVKEQLA